MTRYADFDKLEELTKLTKTEEGYSKFIQTGNLSLYDYDRGFIDLDICVCMDHDKTPRVRIWFGTIDDGDFGGWLVCSSKEQAESIVEAVAHNVFKDMVAFPKDEELNVMLRPYGLYVCYE